MADNLPPRIARVPAARLKSTGLKVMHPHLGGGGGARIPSAGGGGARGSIGGGGLAQSFGAGSTGREGGDPAVSGDFDRNPTLRFYGFPIAGGGLTDKGQQDKEDYDTLKAGRVAYASAIARGATDKEAAQAAVKAGGIPLLIAMSGHPSNPLSSSASMHSFLSGQGFDAPNGPVYGGVDKQGQQISFDPQTGEALEAKQVPGFAQPGAKTKADTRLDAQGNRVHGLTDLATGVFTPGTTAFGTSDVDANPKMVGGKPQPDLNNPYGVQAPIQGKGQIDQKTLAMISRGPAVMNAMKDIVANIDSVGGLGKEPVQTLVARLAGTNPAAQTVLQGINTLKAYAGAMAGSPYKTNVENWLSSLQVGNSAPAFVKSEMGTAMENLRQITQTQVDTATRDTQRIGLPAEKTLETMGVIASGYQTPQYLSTLSPTVAARWRLNNDFGDHTDATTIANAHIVGDLTPTEKGRVGSAFQKWKSTQQAQQTQQAASTAAASANQPAPQSASDLANAGGQEQAQKGQPQAAAPQQPQNNGAQPNENQQGNPPGQGTTPSGQPQNEQAAAPIPPPVQPLMAPQAQPGAPAEMVPGTGGQAIIPPVNPLPGVAQTLTPQGNVPNPASATPLSAAPMGVSPAQAVAQDEQALTARQVQSSSDQAGQTIPIPPVGVQ